MKETTLYRINPAKNISRFYRIDIQTDLFGNPCLIRRWGRVGKAGQMKTMPFATQEEAEQELAKFQRMKTKRGYKPQFTQASAATLH